MKEKMKTKRGNMKKKEKRRGRNHKEEQSDNSEGIYAYPENKTYYK